MALLSFFAQEFEQKENPDIFYYDDYYCRERKRESSKDNERWWGGQRSSVFRNQKREKERMEPMAMGPLPSPSLKAATQMSGTADLHRAALLLAQVEMVILNFLFFFPPFFHLWTIMGLINCNIWRKPTFYLLIFLFDFFV